MNDNIDNAVRNARMSMRVGPASAEPPRKRLGRFHIALALINVEDPVLRQIMSSVIVVDARGNFGTGCIEYLALSSEFPEIIITEPVPVYDAIVTRHEDGHFSFEWKRKP